MELSSTYVACDDPRTLEVHEQDGRHDELRDGVPGEMFEWRRKRRSLTRRSCIEFGHPF